MTVCLTLILLLCINFTQEIHLGKLRKNLDNGTLTVRHGFPLILNCYVGNNTVANITWYKEAEEFFPKNEEKHRIHLEENNQLLVFQETEEQDIGRYECKIQTTDGDIKKYTDLFFSDEFSNSGPSSEVIIVVILACIFFLAISPCAVFSLLLRYEKIRKNQQHKNMVRRLKLVNSSNSMDTQLTLEEREESSKNEEEQARRDFVESVTYID